MTLRRLRVTVPQARRIAAALALVVAWQAVAMAQSPSYTTRPRSNGGRAAGFGSLSPGRAPSRPTTGGTQAARGGAMNGAMGGAAPAPRGGAPRPAIGSAAPSTPFKGNGSAARAGAPRASGPGMQVFSAEQLKAGSGQPVGVRRQR